MRLVFCPDEIPGVAEGPVVFLAGPSLARGSGENDTGGWRERAIDELTTFDGIVLHPESPNRNVDVVRQSTWDFDGCNRADAIAFWIPRDKSRFPGLTSNFELGLWLRSGKVVVGYPPEAYAMAYIDATVRRFDLPVSNDLRETVRLASRLAMSRHRAR